jgi:hypothetical protein
VSLTVSPSAAVASSNFFSNTGGLPRTSALASSAASCDALKTIQKISNWGIIMATENLSNICFYQPLSKTQSVA